MTLLPSAVLLGGALATLVIFASAAEPPLACILQSSSVDGGQASVGDAAPAVDPCFEAVVGRALPATDRMTEC